MISSVFFQLCSLFYIVLLIGVYFSKKRLSSLENKVYISLAIINFFGLILDIFSIYTIKNMYSLPLLNIIVTKSYLIYLLTWIILFTIYIFVISNRKKEENEIKKYNKKIFKIFSIIYLAITILIIFLIFRHHEMALMKIMFSKIQNTN